MAFAQHHHDADQHNSCNHTTMAALHHGSLFNSYFEPAS